MLQNFNSLAPPDTLSQYLKECSSSEFQYRQRAVLIRYPDDTWHVVCCVVQAFSKAEGYPRREKSRHYDIAVLYEGWRDAESCHQLIADLEPGLLQIDKFILERRPKATWNSEFVSSMNPMMGRAGLIVRTRFELETVTLGADPLVGRNLPFYGSVEDAARDWLPFNEYHGQSDARNQEVLFLLPEFRARLTGAVWSNGILNIDIDGSDARAGLPLLIKGTYQLGNATKHFEKLVVQGKVTTRVPSTARRCKFILSNPDDRIFDIRDAPTEILVQEPDGHSERPSDDQSVYDDQRQSIVERIPASDRVVRLNHNSKSYRETMKSLDQLIEAVETTNDYDDEEDKDERLAELSAGRRLLEAVRVKSHVVWLLLGSAILWLIEKFADGFISEIGKVALGAVRTLLGL